MTGLPVERVATRLRMTEGQLYSATITLVIAVLLVTGLGNVHGVVSSALAQPLLAPDVTSAPPPVTAPAPAPGLPPAPAALPPLSSGTVPLPAPYPSSPSYSAEPLPSEAPPPSPDPTPKPSPTPAPCTAQPVADTGAGLIWTLDGAAGGGLPDEDLIAAIALVTGCQPRDPDPSPSPSGSAGPLGPEGDR